MIEDIIREDGYRLAPLNHEFEAKLDRARKYPLKNRSRVQSLGEQRIGNWLFDMGVEFLYDRPIRLPDIDNESGKSIEKTESPDFHMIGKVILEYWGWYGHTEGSNRNNYRDDMLEKIRLYSQANFRLIHVFPMDLRNKEQTEQTRRMIMTQLLMYQVPGTYDLEARVTCPDGTKPHIVVPAMPVPIEYKSGTLISSDAAGAVSVSSSPAVDTEKTAAAVPQKDVDVTVAEIKPADQEAEQPQRIGFWQRKGQKVGAWLDGDAFNTNKSK
jgi:hypothetical protein